jgi:DNA-binding transcriptional LysR family regulator
MFEDFRLKVFLAVAKEGSFTNAAKSLGVSQPAVSQNIAEIEKGIGVKLFDRIRGEVSLTDTGQSFKKYAENILYWYSAADSMFGSAGKMTSSRPIRIAADPLVASFILPSAIMSMTAGLNPIQIKALNFIINSYDKPDIEDADIRIFLKPRNEGIVWDGLATLIGVVQASVIASSINRKVVPSSLEAAFSGLGDMPSDGKLAVWQPYEPLMSLDVVSMISLRCDAIEPIIRLVRGSADYIGVVPQFAVKDTPEIAILPVPMPHLQMDVQFHPSEEFASKGLCKLIRQAVSDSLA